MKHDAPENETVASPACRPNFSAAGRRRRQRAIMLFVGMTVMLGIALFVADAPKTWRALVALPLGAAVTSWLQVRRRTCVVHGMAGTFEHDDFTTTPAAKDDARASKRVAWTILRDAGIVSLLAALALITV